MPRLFTVFADGLAYARRFPVLYPGHHTAACHRAVHVVIANTAFSVAHDTVVQRPDKVPSLRHQRRGSHSLSLY